MSAHPLEPSREQLSTWFRQVETTVLDHLDGMATADSGGPLGEAGLALADEVSTPLPDEPLEGGLTEVLRLVGRAAEATLNTTSPGYLAYVPGGGIPTAALADTWSNVFNRFTGLAAAAPALCRLEADVLTWLAHEFGYDDRARGLLTSGGSLANFSAVVAAREKLLGEDVDLRTATAYTSGQVHHCIAKCTRLAGLPFANLRQVDVDDRWRLDPDALRKAIAADRAAGQRPFLIVASSGTTNTGAIDPLPELAAIAKEEDLWLHVDGAYGAAFVLCDEGRRRLEGLGEADSITFDPHKGLFLPYGTGCLLVKDGEDLRRAHRVGASYLQDFDALDRSREAPSATDYGPELSRDYRGLRIWLPFMLHGTRVFRETLAEKIEVARYIHDELVELVEGGAPLEIVAEPQLSIGAFRLKRRDGESLDDWNRRNTRLQDGINDRQRVRLSSTNLPVHDGAAFTLRTCVLSFRTHEEHGRKFLEDLRGALEDLT
ncbi:MAG: aminotransferase class V-fold PLP-dependent enzyme [Acidobacteriota bacterium]